ncbi:sel1 repeat family protein [Halomonas sp. McH1-25]|uniref:tetratricopeptide repeat protein n=1 Tax=unclassified Halomonas TaxID=2609666 RepID=UPI001EF4AC1A|nr:MULTISPECIES: tetratricopeptide repeat protein [unclassified Halomonas]MCG7601731.1 sel1 repeat family protein [Halomonas sp. McH1-25]MCP1344562.1 sel1 repeat family protein [Halomonas sp. FL8]MCP1360708.1 sel1 repeat family protein [Halomonas sp. BBD45]MCP1364995.1 sel1 repeat family protein [Halomonas sp. BBD48]
MPQASSLFTRLEYRLAEQLFQTRWLPRSPRTQRLTMHLFQRCAEAGHTAALSVYGNMLFHRGMTPQDKARGARYVLQAAQSGDPEAQYQAALIYEHGCAQYPQRTDNAVTWYARAGEAGHRLAARRLAQAYWQGELDLMVDTQRAAHWQAIADQPVYSAELGNSQTH